MKGLERLTAFEKGDRRGAEVIHLFKIRLGTVPFGEITTIQALLGDDLQVGVVEPVAVFVEIADFGESGSGGKTAADGR